jgi:hypothetical protein
MAQHAFATSVHDPGRVGSIKHTWELSRHQHTTVLAAAYWATADERYAEAAAAQVTSWWLANPPLRGVNWTSTMELGVRLVSWAWVRRLVDGWPGASRLFEENPVAAQQLWWHQHYLSSFPSRGSSANNHVIGELTGLLVGSSAFPWFPESHEWYDGARRELAVQLARQTFPSGLNREQSSGYHCWVLENALVAMVEMQLNGDSLGAPGRQAVAAMADATAAIIDERLRLPRQGDNDDGTALLFDGTPGLVPARTLTLAAAVLGPLAWWPRLAKRDVRATVLETLLEPSPSRQGAACPPDTFADAGMVILHRERDGGELWCRVDAGPFGFLSIAAHAHADALAVEIRHAGVDLIADPGNSSYGSEPEWRAFFRSTSAHATLQLDGAEQAEQWGPFLWGSRAEAEIIELARADDGSARTVVARHTGYRRLRPPLDHTRTVSVGDDDRADLLIHDVVHGAASADVRSTIHLGPDVELLLTGSVATLSWTVDGRQHSAELVLDANLSWSAHRGELAPPLGWYSPRFGVRVPTWALVGRGRVTRPIALRTTLRLVTCNAARHESQPSAHQVTESDHRGSTTGRLT